ncbi:nitroreductase [Pedobacter panaciterrae]
MNETINTIYQRRAVRKYKPIPLNKQMLDELISAGKMAPSAMNKQPWKFYILTDTKQIFKFSKAIEDLALKKIRQASPAKAVRTTLSFFHFSTLLSILKNKDHVFYGAPAVIFITQPRNDEWGSLDIGMCAQNIMLAAASMGLDTCPVGFGKYIVQTPDYAELNIPSGEEVALAIVVGYGDETPPARKRTKNNIHYQSPF